MRKKFCTFSYRFICILSLLLLGFLFLSGFLFTCYADNMDSQLVLTRWDNPFFNLLGIGLLLLFLYSTCRFHFPKGFSPLFFVVIFWYLLGGIILILFSKTTPTSDAWSVYSAAEVLAGGDLSVIHPTDSYLSYYPQQMGLVAFYEVLIRFWNLFSINLHAYHFIKCIYLIFACISIYFQYRTVHLLWEDERTDNIYLLLAGLNLPFLMYTSFVYGEIPSYTAMSIGFYCFYQFLKRLEIKDRHIDRYLYFHGFFSLLFLSLSVLFRKNSLILIIAVLIVTALQWLQTRNTKLLVFGLLCAILSFNILPLTEKSYELRADSTLKTGVPALSYLAMGMQKSSRGNGWYNGFNFYTYQDTGMDTEVTENISKEAIRERLTYFKENPGYAARFYFYKHLSQWADGTYASRQATVSTFGGRRSFFVSLYEGRLSTYYIGFCNVYQNVLYLGALLFCISNIRKRSTHKNKQKETGSCLSGLPVYLGMIGVVGGFLFHILWEANARYIFLYGLLLMPYAAKGLAAFSISPAQRSEEAL